MPFAPEPIQVLGAAAADSKKGELYVYRCIDSGGFSNEKVGLYTYQVDPFRQRAYFPIPSNREGTEFAKGRSVAYPWFDLPNDRVFFERLAMSLRTGTGDWFDDLDRSSRLDNAVAGQHLLFARKEPKRNAGITLYYLNRQTLKVDNTVYVPPPGPDREIYVHGAAGDYVLVAERDWESRPQRKSEELVVYRDSENRLEEVSRLSLDNFWPAVSAIDARKRQRQTNPPARPVNTCNLRRILRLRRRPGDPRPPLEAKTNPPRGPLTVKAAAQGPWPASRVDGRRFVL